VTKTFRRWYLVVKFRGGPTGIIVRKSPRERRRLLRGEKRREVVGLGRGVLRKREANGLRVLAV